MNRVINNFLTKFKGKKLIVKYKNPIVEGITVIEADKIEIQDNKLIVKDHIINEIDLESAIPFDDD